MLIAGAAIFVLVMALLLAAWLRPIRGARAGIPTSTDADERRWILGLGIAFPVAVLVVLLGYGLVIGERLLPRAGSDIVGVKGEARQWAWTFSYDDLPGLTTLDVLHIPAGRPIDVAITTTDVIHSFWVPRLAGKLDAIPGHVNVLRLEADAPGVFAGLSSEFNGRGYDRHAFTVIAHSTAEWQAFLEGAR